MPSPGGRGISKSAPRIGGAKHRGAAFPDPALASGINARRTNPEQWLTICWENRTTVTGADPSGKPRRIIRSAAPLPYRFGGSEPNGEIRILDVETIKG